MSSTKLQALVLEAETATEGVKDPELRKAAMQTVLAHLLQAGTPPSGERSAQRQPSKAAVKIAPSTEKTGLMGRLVGLTEEGFFQKPKSVPEIVSVLAERACHVKASDLTWQVAKLVTDRVLRRKKDGPQGKRQVWMYSNW